MHNLRASCFKKALSVLHVGQVQNSSKFNDDETCTENHLYCQTNLNYLVDPGDKSLNPALVEAPTLIFFASLAMDQQEFVFSCSSELEVHVHTHQFLRLGMRKQLDWFHL